MQEKKEKQQNYQTWIDLSLRKLKKIHEGPCPLLSQWLGAYSTSLIPVISPSWTKFASINLGMLCLPLPARKLFFLCNLLTNLVHLYFETETLD